MLSTLFYLTLTVGPAHHATMPCCDMPPHSRPAGQSSKVITPKNIEPDLAGMALIPSGTFWMGIEKATLPDAGPVHKVYVHRFAIDKELVTNDQFAAFVKATGYVTVAERKLDPKDFPGVPIASLKSGSVVFTAPRQSVPLDNPSNWWRYVPGANWKHPLGPWSNIAGKGKYPVVQVAWEDANAYATWVEKRLPTEAEFEYASRGGLDRKLYGWGNELTPHGVWRANIFQGHFPDRNTCEDGFSGPSPVGSYPANGYGLYDMTGNVWEWCLDWYRPNAYSGSHGRVVKDPRGPLTGFDPDEPNVPKRVQRGGSFLCSDQYCVRYMVGARGKCDPNTATNNAGFRCVISGQ